jgi:hypothetical protein
VRRRADGSVGVGMGVSMGVVAQDREADESAEV